MCVNLLFRERYHLYQAVVCVCVVSVCARARASVSVCVCVCSAVIMYVRRVVMCGPMNRLRSIHGTTHDVVVSIKVDRHTDMHVFLYFWQ